MSRSTMKWVCRIVCLLSAVVVSVLVAPSAYSQQEVDPTWYDPWATPRKAVAQPSPPPIPSHKPNQKSGSQPRASRKARLNPPGNRGGQLYSKHISKLPKKGE